MKIVPANKNLLVKLEKEESTAMGIILPDEAREKPKYGIVEAVASDCSILKVDEIFDSNSMPELVGSKVLFKPYAGSRVKIDKQEYLLLPEDEVLGFVVEEPVPAAS